MKSKEFFLITCQDPRKASDSCPTKPRSKKRTGPSSLGGWAKTYGDSEPGQTATLTIHPRMGIAMAAHWLLGCAAGVRLAPRQPTVMPVENNGVRL